MRKLSAYIIIIILSVLLVVSNADNIKQITGYAVSEPEADSFSTYTKAVCEENEKGIYCEDKLFVRCNNIEQEVEIPNGEANFSSDWEDPRCQ